MQRMSIMQATHYLTFNTARLRWAGVTSRVKTTVHTEPSYTAGVTQLNVLVSWFSLANMFILSQCSVNGTQNPLSLSQWSPNWGSGPLGGLQRCITEGVAKRRDCLPCPKGKKSFGTTVLSHGLWPAQTAPRIVLHPCKLQKCLEVPT